MWTKSFFMVSITIMSTIKTIVVSEIQCVVSALKSTNMSTEESFHTMSKFTVMDTDTIMETMSISMEIGSNMTHVMETSLTITMETSLVSNMEINVFVNMMYFKWRS